MPRLTQKVPAYRCHKASGQAVVSLNGQDYYLGPWKSKASQLEYDRLIGEWLTGGKQSLFGPGGRTHLTIAQVVNAFRGYAEGYYRRPDGTVTAELDNFRQALRPLRELYGRTAADQFGPLALRAIQQKMVELGWCRSNINKQVGRIKTFFKWAASREMVPPSVYHGLQTVTGLKRGRCDARESEPVAPVPVAFIEAVRPFVSRQVWAMIQLQLLMGARAGELVGLRPVDIDTTGRVWTCRPAQHKTAWRGVQRVIYFGPRAQVVLRPFLDRPTHGYCFSPDEAERERRQRVHAGRETPLSQGNTPGSNRVGDPQVKPGDCYDVASYRRSIQRACDRAFPPPGELAQREDETHRQWRGRLNDTQKRQLTEWRQQHSWHPHQLRHNAATQLRKEFGLEVARVILGHRSPAITETYAELDHTRAVDVMAKVG